MTHSTEACFDKRRRGPAAWMVAFVLICLSPLTARGNALLSDDLRLYIPWISVENRVFSLDLTFTAAGADAYFSVAGMAERSSALPAEAQNAAAILLPDGITLRVPRLVFQGNVFAVDLSVSARNGTPVLEVGGVLPAAWPEGRGTLVSVAPAGSFSVGQLSAGFFLSGISFFPTYGVTLSKVIYRTADPFGNPVEASGLLALPQGAPDALPLVSYQHGTAVLKTEAPSANASDGFLVAVSLASAGYAAVAPDYLGIGDSSGLHPFVHAKSLAVAVVDMLRAARPAVAASGNSLNGQVFLAGYSEGGYATMAAHREIEAFHSQELDLAAVAPMAGPYSVSGTMRDLVTGGLAVPHPYYFPYTVLSYDRVYGLFDSYQEAFTPEMAAALPPLFDGTRDGAAINAAMGTAIPRLILSAEFLTRLENDPGFPVNMALRENDVYRFVPRAPTRLYHCTDDDQVPFFASQTAFDYFSANGAVQTELIPLPFGNHVDCAIPALLEVKAWFDTLRQ